MSDLGPYPTEAGREFWGPEGPSASYGEWLADLDAYEARMDAALDEPEAEL